MSDVFLFENSKKVKEFSKNSKELAREKYSRFKYYNDLMSIYNKVIKEK